MQQQGSQLSGDFAPTGLISLLGCMPYHISLLLEIKKMALKIPAPNHGSTGNNEMPEDWQLRRVPAGPDPLHHNGQDPKKPRTP
ncbi:hypothetical protein C2S51_011410 [Perilla frutescens var. frutescens]|nr:hypothetical protein C2S51_011410 [Perilla frutescens var. frutescens]